VSVLNRKLARDLLGNAWELVTVIAVIAVGAGTLIGSVSAQHRLDKKGVIGTALGGPRSRVR